MPSVLAVLLVRDAAEWLRESLQSLGAQTYGRIAVLAIDDGSTDGSHDLLVHALGEGRVVRHDRPHGIARSFDEVTALPVAKEADFLLLLHDDVALDPESVARLVEATTLPGVEGVGIVGAKIVDWTEQRRLRDVGRSADRFGHPYTPLQAGEIDQGQFDRVLDVLSVDSCAMLVARDVWQRIGLFDERLGDDDADLDLCWRARLAGFRVLMTPRARVRHRAAGERDDRPGVERSRRHEEDRAALAAVLKNYGLVSLLWIVPAWFVLSVVRLAYLVLSRRFDEAYELVAAFGWNVVHLPGTWSRRRKAQKARRVRDHALRHYMESAGLRIPRWFQTAERLLEEQRELDEEEEGQPAALRMRHRTASFVSTHPVIVACALGLIVGALSARHLLGPARLAGGALPAFPATPDGFFRELVSAYRTTGLGGSLAASPALAGMGALSFVLLGSTALAQKALLIGGPALAAILCYRASVRLTGRPGPSSAAAAAYGLSALTLWAYSDGRLPVLAALVVLPPIVERVDVGFRADLPADGRWRFTAGLAVTLAVGIAFEPGVLLAFAVLLAVSLAFGAARLRGLGGAALAVLGAAVLLFPFVPTLLAGGGASLGALVGTTDPWRTLRLVMGDAPGSWPVAYFLPLAAILALSLARGEQRAPARRLTVVALAGLALAWSSAAGYLPAPLANAPVYAVLAGVAEAFVIASGLTSVAGRIERESFGLRQIGTALLTVVLTTGLVLQALAAMAGQWAVGGTDKVPAAWAVVDSASKGSFRVLWVGGVDGRSFPPPGGDPEHVVDAGTASITYAVTDRTGQVAIDTARPLAGPGATALELALQQVLSGGTVHAGALLAPFGIRYVVGDGASIPPQARAAFASQVDLDVVQATGLFILRNAIGLPPASVATIGPQARRIVASGDPATIQELQPLPTTPLPSVEGGWAGPTEGHDTALVSTEYDGAWRLEGTETSPARAFGWATSFTVSGRPDVRIVYGSQLPRTIELWVLLACWLVALWVTRKPVRR
ncbi:MAG: glycosyltransferase family 2 protein [Planctomycetaceae bacterium]